MGSYFRRGQISMIKFPRVDWPSLIIDISDSDWLSQIIMADNV